MLVLSVVLVTLAYMAILVRSMHNPLHLYDFSQSFRLQFGGQCLGGIVVYSSFILAFRHLLDVLKQRKMGFP